MRIAIIPARGGSKRIPRKNIKFFHGKPIIAYSIDVALQSGLFDEIVVSTDDSEIADIATSLGASVPFVRPTLISNDTATTIDVVSHAITWMQKRYQDITDVCCLYATAPFLQVSDLQRGYKLLTLDQNTQYAFSATSFSFPVQRSLRLTNDGGVEPMFPEFIESRSQDLEESFHDAGQFYWGHAQAFLDNKPIFGRNSKPVLLPRSQVQDIDTMEDWVQAEILFSVMQEGLV